MLKMCYDGSYKAFLLRNDVTFEQFIARIYQVLKLSSDEYSMTVKIFWAINCPIQLTTSLLMDILDDKMVNIIIHINSDPINYGRTSIYNYIA